MNTPEIKAGQRWKFPSDKVTQWDGSAVVVEIKLVDDSFVYLRDTEKYEAFTVELNYFIKYYEPVPELKTRPITKDDIMKMLAEDSSLYFRINSEGWWYLLVCPEGLKALDGYQFSHNPFAPNAEIVGPEIEEIK